MKKNIYLLCLISLCISCSSTDDATTRIDDDDFDGFGTGYVTAIVNGETVRFGANVDQLEGVAAVFSEAQSLFGLAIVGSRLSSVGNYEDLGIVLVGNDLTEVTSGFEVNYVNDDDYLLTGNYTLIVDDLQENEYDVTESANLKITNIDEEAQTISGEFSFVIRDFLTGASVVVTNGEFQGISYNND